MSLIALLPWTDWLALLTFVSLWVGYALFARYWGHRQSSLLITTNRYRARWMLEATERDPRMLDGLITQSLAHTPSFFSSTSILVVGGLIAVLGTTERASDLMSEIPFAQVTSLVVFEFKIISMVAIFVYAFFRFTWCLRQYTFVALVIGAMPSPKAFEADEGARRQYANRAAALVGSAAESFNDGLRAYYFAFAALAWFLSPLAMVISTLVVIGILFHREFGSDALAILRD